MAYLQSTVQYETQRPRARYTYVRARVQRSTDGELTWHDVHSENLPLGAQPPHFPIPENAQAGKYRLGFVPTNGVDFGDEVFTNVVNAAEPEPLSINRVA